MAQLVFIVPILAERLEAWYRFLQEIQGRRREEYESWRQPFNIMEESWWLVQAGRRQLVLASIQVTSPGDLMQEVIAGDDSFARWFQRQVLDLHGVDITAIRSAELVYRHTFSDSKDSSK